MAWHEVNKIQGDFGTYKIMKLKDDIYVSDYITMLDDMFWIRTTESENKDTDYEIVRDNFFPASLKFSSKVLKFPHVIIQDGIMCFVMPGQNVKTNDRALRLNKPVLVEDGIYVCYTKDFEYDPQQHMLLTLEAHKYYQRYLLSEIMNLHQQFDHMARSLYSPEVIDILQQNIRVAIEDNNKEYASLAKNEVSRFNLKLKKLLSHKEGLYNLIYDVVKDV